MSKVKRKAVVQKGCVACGNCVKHCPINAISVYKGMYALTNDKCVGCARCQKACPADLIQIVGKEA